ncbi:MAG: hypothetical protein U0804_24725 [Gemmataceae bacterium]
MADGPNAAPGFSFRAAFPWMSIFRCFQVALDPRKLLVAAAGILVMSIGWWVLSALFYYKAPDRSAPEYSNGTISKEKEGQKKPGTDASYTEADFTDIGNKRFAADFEKWRVMADLAGPADEVDPATKRPIPVGRFRAAPWDEYRGPNPFLFATNVLAGGATERADAIGRFISGSIPVLVEPLVKLLVPVAKMVSPGVGAQTRVYLFFLILWNVAVWAFFGGVITRLAAVSLSGRGPVTLKQAVQFVTTRYVNYALSPMVPLAIIGVVIVGLFVYGTIALIPLVGDILLIGLLLPLVLLAGVIMAIFLVGLVGYPLMYPTLSVEGDSSDTFDALSRSVNYVYQSPWHYLWYWFVAVLYGAIVTFFVLFFTSLAVYVGKWAVGLPASTMAESRKPEYLFIYAPESFGWKELFLQGSPYEVTHSTAVSPTGRVVDVYSKKDAAEYDRNRADFYWFNTWGAGLVGFWLGLAFLMMLGFSYSFFWTAATAVYFLMRKKVDEAEPDEVFLEDDEPQAPPAPPKSETPAIPSGPVGGTPLTVITAPPSPPAPVPPPPVVVSPPPPVPVTPPALGPGDAPKPDDKPIV